MTDKTINAVTVTLVILLFASSYGAGKLHVENDNIKVINEELNAEMVKLSEAVKLAQTSYADVRDFRDERCVCMYYSYGNKGYDFAPKTKDQICSADDEDLYFWEDSCK